MKKIFLTTLNKTSVIMLSVQNNLLSFLDWLRAIMREKGISQADIAKTGYVTESAVSLLLTARVKSVGVDMCRAIAAATGIPLATVYAKAGLLPPDPGLDPWVEEQKRVISELTGARRKLAERLLQGLLEEENASNPQTIQRPANAAKTI